MNNNYIISILLTLTVIPRINLLVALWLSNIWLKYTPSGILIFMYITKGKTVGEDTHGENTVIRQKVKLS